MKEVAISLFLIIIIMLTASCSSEQLTATDRPVETAGDISKRDSSNTPFPEEPTVFDENTNDNQNGFAPGIILLGLKEPIDSSLEEFFPDLNIAEYYDVDERVYNRFKDNPTLKEQAEEYRSRIGTNFVITLTEETSDAVLRGIEILRESPKVAYAQPDYYAYPSD